MLDAYNDAPETHTETYPSERRSNPHLPIHLPIKVKSIKENRLHVIEGVTRDINDAGAGIILTKSLPAHRKFSVEIEFAEVCPFFEIPFEVIWSGPLQSESQYTCGIRFSTCETEKRKALAKMLRRMQAGKNEADGLKAKTIPRIRDLKDTSTLRDWMKQQFNYPFSRLTGSTVLDAQRTARNIENFVGAAQIPVGIGGPIRVNGQFAQGDYYVPFATTEGTLVETYQYGMVLITRSGGANTFISGNQMDITPIFVLDDLAQAVRFTEWVRRHLGEIKTEAEKTTKHGRLLEIKPFIIGREVMLSFCFHTGDAMGMNIANLATDGAARYIAEKFGVKRFYLRCNFSSDKKPAGVNLIKPYGKEVTVDATIPRKLLKRFYATTPEDVRHFYYCGTLGTVQCGMLGMNGHFANGLAAIYIACGQDVAQIVNASIGIVGLEVTENGDLYIAARLPNLIVGTVGGGTGLPTQQECLRMIGCLGDGKAEKFAEIIAATLLAGELSMYSALTTGGFVDAHRRKRTL